MSMKLMTTAHKALLAGVALSACLGFALNAQAQTCTVGNWNGGATGLTDANAGTQGTSNRRYGGPCGLRVPVDGTARYVTDDTPGVSAGGEPNYIARFYVFLDAAGSDPVQLFAADDGSQDQIQVWYNSPSAGNLTLRVFDQAGTPTDIIEPSAGTGWHSVEFVWEADASAQILYSVDGATDLSATVDTSTLAIRNASLGNVNGATGGSVDFDDFDSRRSSRPGRLLLADSNNDSIIDIFDVQATGTEVTGGADAPGQPDCNEDGTIDIFDVQCTGAIVTGS